MPVDLSEFRELGRKADRKSGCKMQRIRQGLSDGDRTMFDAALDDADTTHSEICLWVLERGTYASKDTVGRHRRGECGCARA